MAQHVLRLDVVGGSERGKVVLIPDRTTIVVGRLPDCGLPFPTDETVSRRHFQIDFQKLIGQLTHLSQTGPTFVNGESVKVAELRHGDEIQIGEGNRILVSYSETRDGQMAPTVNMPQANASSPSSTNAITVAKASCGWNLYESPASQPDFARLFGILINLNPMYAVIDFARIGHSVLTDLREPEYLFSWLDSPVLEQRSPLVTPVLARSTVDDLIYDAWGKDGIVCFGSELKLPELARHWRKAIGVVNDRPGAGMTAYFWPSILNLILTCQSSDQVAPLLDGLSWILIEYPKSPGMWRLFAKADLGADLKASGLVAEPAKSK